MTEKPVISQDEKQPNPVPPPIPVMEAPSLLLYVGLLTIAVILVWLAFKIGESDWPGLFINLASGIIGAVLILILVDRRLRVNEVRMLRDYAETTSVRIVSIFSYDIRSAIQYAQVFQKQLHEIQLEFYISIPAAEAITDQNPEGFFLIGMPGSGKSTLLQKISIDSTKRVVQQPKEAPIPVFLPAAYVGDGNLDELAWKEMRKYYLIKRKLFDKWLSAGRLTIFVDGIDECINPKNLLNEIAVFKINFPEVVIVLSSRNLLLTTLSKEIERIGLPIVEMPSLTEEEMNRFISMASKFYDKNLKQ